MDWRGWAIQTGAALLALGGLLALPAMIPRQAFWRRASRFSAMAGAVICLAAAIAGWVRMGRPPVGSASEMLLFLGPALALAYFVSEGLAKSREAGLPLLLVAAGLVLAGWSGSPDPAIAGRLPMPMHSRWMGFCVAADVVAYGFLFAAGVQAAVLLIVRELWPRRAERAGRAVYWSVCLGFPFLLCSMLMTAVWAQGMRGSYWSWTGREVWTLAYCLALLAYLNLHLIAGWRERRAAWFLVVVSLAGLAAFARLREFPTSRRDRSMESFPGYEERRGPRPRRGAISRPGHEKG